MRTSVLLMLTMMGLAGCHTAPVACDARLRPINLPAPKDAPAAAAHAPLNVGAKVDRVAP